MAMNISPGSPLSFTQETPGRKSDFIAQNILVGDRYAELDRRQSYYDCTQHDGKRWDFDGRIINSPRAGSPLMTGSEQVAWYVPLKMRRPSTPYRLAKVIVDAFTNLLFGENRFPTIRVDGDEETQDFARALVKASNLPLKMVEARGIGGAMGTVGLSWGFVNGKPCVDVHNPKHLYVHEWEDRAQLIPKHVTEVCLYARNEWDGRRFARVMYWFRRDWMPNADIVFCPVKYEVGKEPAWDIDVARSNQHDDGACHFVWIQNLPSEEIDGVPDFDGQYESLDSVDMLFSIVTRGATLNLDPTLKLKLDPELIKRAGIQKGSDNALIVGKDGDAEYLELGGQSIDAGVKLLEFLRRSVLEAAQCIVPDPNQVAAQGISSVSIKAMFAPMLGKSDVHRGQYGGGIERLLNQMVKVAIVNKKKRVPVIDAETGVESQAMPMVTLPMKIVRTQIIDPLTNKPTGEYKVEKFPRLPGEGGDLDLQWPPHFLPTPADQTQIVNNLSMATGGKSFLSKETAIELVSNLFGVDSAQEVQRIADQSHADAAAQAPMFPDVGGGVEDAEGLPPGATPRKPKEPSEPEEEAVDDEAEEPASDA